ncbi:MAG: UvrD-helicase domain-containing protein, partial [Steroidobacteraceae bacterium]
MSDRALELDEAARAEASAPGASILLEAPAGSGKTAVLARRFLALLASVDDPDEILAITFTRKAAAEMRARVARALRGEHTPGDPEAERLRALAAAALARAAARGWSIATEPQALRIQTIDSFNYWLATQLPVASRAGGTLTVAETAGELYRRAARRTLLGAESDPELAPDALLLFERLDNHWLNFEQLIAQMLGERAHWLRFVVDEDPGVLCARVSASLAALTRERLRALQALIPVALRQRAAMLPGVAALGIEPADLGYWKRCAQLLLTRTDWRKQLSARLLDLPWADPSVLRQLRDLIADLAPLPGAR